MYPPDWPRCHCGDYALDGHVTCGRLECNESQTRYVSTVDPERWQDSDEVEGIKWKPLKN